MRSPRADAAGGQFSKGRQPRLTIGSDGPAEFERHRFSADVSVPKAFIYCSYGVAVFLVVLFGLDLATAWPFWRASWLFDASAVLCGAVLGYLAWDTHREWQRQAWKT